MAPPRVRIQLQKCFQMLRNLLIRQTNMILIDYFLIDDSHFFIFNETWIFNYDVQNCTRYSTGHQQQHSIVVVMLLYQSNRKRKQYLEQYTTTQHHHQVQSSNFDRELQFNNTEIKFSKVAHKIKLIIQRRKKFHTQKNGRHKRE